MCLSPYDNFDKLRDPRSSTQLAAGSSNRIRLFPVERATPAAMPMANRSEFFLLFHNNRCGVFCVVGNDVVLDQGGATEGRDQGGATEGRDQGGGYRGRVVQQRRRR